ncbi:non-homologous end-joining DNA ligase [Streptomyces gobiensis]|uniref:non-homologous end-joining DNA ligase n=1 Tax=Streptomyces gobiensis TaxID=2875706 RepID=UPI001E44BC89|nr:non-homologous end-joining DNA ligase [Streptomyces gobiensis]UGY94892.1 non-homologous end-joining DNA ligase [Streptomyces gobiensis]
MAPMTIVEGRRLALSNLEKVLYPSSGTTKGELVHYYARTAPVMLPHLYGRPVSFLRYPDGPEGQKFFTKNVPPHAPEWVQTYEIPRSDGTVNEHVLVQDVPSLLWAANLVVEFHTTTWRTTAGRGLADLLVFDLDPGKGATVVDCCTVAQWLHGRLTADGLSVYPKTSGSVGLHVLVPITLTPAKRATAYAKSLAEEAERALPDLVVHRMTRSLRPGKVFIDYSQNAAAKTTATAYTVRARQTPTVSTPVTWAEIEACTQPDQLAFQIDDIFDRLEDHGDLMAPLTAPDRSSPLPADPPAT